MAVPDFQSWLLPLLRRVSDGEVHVMSDLYEPLADELQLSEEDKAVRLPSGAQQTYMNRVAWARTYLKKAGLLSSPGRSKIQITQRGMETLAEAHERLTVKYLKRFPEFLDFHSVRTHDASDTRPASENYEEETPQESLEQLHKRLRDELASELLDRIKQSSPSFFERLVVDLLVSMGYGGSREDAGRTVGRSGDGGIDGVINEDRLGLDVVYIQAKRWEGTVGRPVVQTFAGSLEGVRANKGVLITTSSFTADAKAYVTHIAKKIVLVDGRQLADFMIQYGVGVDVEATYEVKRIDNDYFDQ